MPKRRRPAAVAEPIEAPPSPVEAAVEEATSDRFLAPLTILKDGTHMDAGSTLRFPAFDHGRPHLLVYEPNMDAWRPISLPPGGIWALAKQPDKAAVLAKLVGVDGRPLS